MIETVIAREGDTLRTYSGRVVNRSADSLVIAAVTGDASEPSMVIIPTHSIISEVPVAA